MGAACGLALATLGSGRVILRALELRDRYQARTNGAFAHKREPGEKVLFAPLEACKGRLKQVVRILEARPDLKRLWTTLVASVLAPVAFPASRRNDAALF